MASEMNGAGLLAAFFDGGAHTALFGGEGGNVLAAYGDVGGLGAYAVCQTGGALSAADVEISCKTVALAAKTGRPVVTFYNAKGAVLTEGGKTLSAAASLSRAAAAVSGVVPQLAVVYGVCGASNALAALAADLCIIAEGAELFLTPPFLSAAAGDAPEGAASAKAAADAGVSALSAKTPEEAAQLAARLLMLLPRNNLAATAQFEYTAPAAGIDTANYTGLSAAKAVADEGSLVELYEGFGDGVITALGTVEGNVAGFVSTNGANTYLGGYCMAKTARFVRLCDAFSIPVVTLLHTGGLVKSSSAEAAGLLRDAARLAATYADATTAKVAVVTGRCVGQAYTVLGSADLTVAMRGCVLAPAEPSAAASVLYKDEIAAAEGSVEAGTAAYAKQYEAEVASADAALAAGLADMVADAPGVRAAVVAALDALATKRTQRMPKKHGNMAL